MTSLTWLALWCPIRSSCWRWLRGSVSKVCGRSSVTTPSSRRRCLKSSQKQHWQVKPHYHITQTISAVSTGFLQVLTRIKVPLLCLFHAVCHVAVCEHKPSATLWSPQCTINSYCLSKKWIGSWSLKRVESYSVTAVCHKETLCPPMFSRTTCYHIL